MAKNYLRGALQLSPAMRRLAAASERRTLTAMERRRLDRAIAVCRNSIREAREAWLNGEGEEFRRTWSAGPNTY